MGRWNLRFWGVRGSIASPGPSTVETGGNTSCVEARLGSRRFVFDAGTGLREAGVAQGFAPFEGTLCISHLHWDHIQGIPFFGPLFHPKTKLHVLGPAGLQRALEKQMHSPSFPITMSQMPGSLTFEELEPGQCVLRDGVLVRSVALSHPGSALGYRLEADSKSIVYACDHEPTEDDNALAAFCRDADVVVADAQYLPEEMESKRGFGHGTYKTAVALARDNGVSTLVLTHHDPSRTDDQVRQIESAAQALFPGACAAREGTCFSLQISPEGHTEAKKASRSSTNPTPCM